MRSPRARGRPRARVRDRQRGHRLLARRRPARPPRDRGGARRAASRWRAPRARSARATSSTSTCCSRWTARTCASCARSRRTATPPARRGCCASSTRRRAGAPDLDVPDPYYGGPDGFETVLDQVEAACRGLLDRCVRSSGRSRGHRPRASRRSSASAAATSTTPSGCSSPTSPSRSSRPARTSRPASTRPRRPALRWLAEPGALRVPEVLGVGDDVLVLDWVDEGGRGDPAAFGAGPGGQVHAGAAPDDVRRAPRAAAPRPARACPTTPRPTGRRSTPSGGCSRCCRTPASPASATARSSASATASHELAGPPEPPARLHGDLWSGNVLWGRDGRAWLIDPAAYGGHREVDLAMLQLFGSPGPALLRRLRASATRSRPGTRSASPLYQLFPLLVHAALFGGGYPASAERVAAASRLRSEFGRMFVPAPALDQRQGDAASS